MFKRNKMHIMPADRHLDDGIGINVGNSRLAA